ncbi:MAG: membrane protein insertase YidC [Nocardioidaceae bacterium]|nr:membrane protein insertase YidC [Nocardioidaceae bacterium]MCL2612772.1 membrane protein insertase YidC [Nocardioidaceae bacterium]
MVPLYYIVSAVLVSWHWLFSLVMDPSGGLSWILSIIGLTVTIRAALIPLFVKQIKSSRNMQLLQPKMKELQKKYGHDRQRLAEESMKLYKETGTNPFASCLPLLLQMPVFFALFRLVDHAAKQGTGNGFLTDTLARQFQNSEIFGRIPITESFWQARTWGDTPNGLVMVVALVLFVCMIATTFTTQRQLMTKNMPESAMSGPYAQQQKMLLYVLPFVFAVTGVAFPIGVVMYWTTSNLWTMGQQFYVIRNNPAPGTPAFKAKQERDRAKASRHGETAVVDADAPEAVATDEPGSDHRPAQRQQPKRQSRAQRKTTPGSTTSPTQNKSKGDAK